MSEDFNENTQNSADIAKSEADMKPENYNPYSADGFQKPQSANEAQQAEKIYTAADGNPVSDSSTAPKEHPKQEGAAYTDNVTEQNEKAEAASQEAQPPVTNGQASTGVYGTQPQYGYIPPENFVQPYQTPYSQGNVYGAYTPQGNQPNFGEVPPFNGQPAFSGQTPFTNQMPDPKNKGSKKGLRIFCIILAAVIVVSTAVTVGFFFGNGRTDGATSAIGSQDKDELINDSLNITVNSKPDSGTADNNGQMTISEIFNFVSPSIVEIYVYNSTGEAYSYSSGIVLSSDGYILTNDHIYSDISGPTIYVSTPDKTKYKGTFVAGDKRRDISIIKIDATGLTAAVFGKSSELVIGEDAYAIGNPAQLENSITNGIVSSVDRRVTNSDGYSEKFIQTNAAISNGSSGGALVNEYGQIVGITSSKYVDNDAEGICFAIPIDNAIEMVNDLLQNGKCTTRAKLGIRYTEINVAYSEKNNCPVGLMFYSANTESSLSKTGIAQGDIITQVNGTDITASSVILDVIDKAKPGDEISLTVWSAATGQYSTYSVTLLADEGSTHYNETASSTDDSSSSQQPLFPDNGQ